MRAFVVLFVASHLLTPTSPLVVPFAAHRLSTAVGRVAAARPAGVPAGGGGDLAAENAALKAQVAALAVNAAQAEATAKQAVAALQAQAQGLKGGTTPEAVADYRTLWNKLEYARHREQQAILTLEANPKSREHLPAHSSFKHPALHRSLRSCEP
jgi:hypothetical protein